MLKRTLPFLGLALLLSACDAGTKPNADITQAKTLHRGELSAVETYDAVLAKLTTASFRTELTTTRAAHADAASKLRDRVTTLGGTPDTTGGAWGDWTSLTGAGVAAVSDPAALRVLKAGEQHGIRAYENALTADDVDETTKRLVRDDLLPKLRDHIDGLEKLLK